MAERVPTPVTARAGPPDLRAFDAEYAAVRPLDSGEVPDGRHTVRLADVQLGRSRNGDPMLTYDVVVLAGPHARRHLFKNAVITSASLPLVKRDLITLGLELEPFSSLPQRLDEVMGCTLDVTKRTNDEYVNVFFNKRVAAPAAAPDGPNSAPF